VILVQLLAICQDITANILYRERLMDFDLSQQEKDYLLVYARQTIAKTLNLPVENLQEIQSEVFQQEAGAFVTLHKKGSLRGCIGYVVARGPLIETIEQMAKAAAFNDPRFKAVKADELDSINVEISVLSPLVLIENIEDIIVGKHGLMLKKGFNSGLLLPQVPVELNWSRSQYLDGLCQKAGVAPGSWADNDSELLSFTAIVFGEL